MKLNKNVLKSGLLLSFLLIVSGTAVADPVTFGITTPIAPSLINQSITFYQLYDGSTEIANVINRQTGANSTSSLTYTNGGYTFTGTASPYDLHGSVTADNSIPSADLNVGTAFRDQLYFTTANGLPAEIVFNFNVNITITDPTSSNFAYAPSLFMSVYNGETLIDPSDPSTIILKHIADPWEYDFSSSFSGPLSVSTLGTGSNIAGDQIGLVDSGTYFPFLIGFNTDIINGSVGWPNSITLDPNNPISIYQYDQNGVRTKLTPDQYTITSMNDNFPSSPVPEPAALLLLSSGLMGLMVLRRKFKK
jgi:hypothetical protein